MDGDEGVRPGSAAHAAEVKSSGEGGQSQARANRRDKATLSEVG